MSAKPGQAAPQHPRRNSYLISGEGVLERVLEGVSPKAHPQEVLDSL